MRARHVALRRPAFGLAAIVLLAVLGRPAWGQSAPFEVKSEMGVMVAMRDGVELATNVFRPDAEGRFPVVLLRTPYGRAEAQQVAWALATRGHACVWQDVRGRFDSDGAWNPFFYDAADGHDVIEWSVEQPWSTGRVVMFGGSYAAGVQWLAAKGGSEHLVGLIPFVSPGDIYDLVWVGGALNQGALQMWASLMERKRFDMQEYDAFQKHPWEEVFFHLPVVDALPRIGHDPAFYREWIEHPTPDQYWEPLSWQSDPPDIPVLHIGGWFDIFQQDTIGNFRVMRTRAEEPGRNRQRLVIGPWAHQGFGRTTGDLDFGADAALDIFLAEVFPFLQSCFEGKEPAWEKPVKVFTMGENRWHELDDWPVPGAETVSYFLGSEQGANSSAGDGRLDLVSPEKAGSSDRFVYDPRDPVPNQGGGNCCWPQVMPWGPMDQREIERRDDVLVFSTPPLEEDVRVTGPVEVVLFASTSARDTDFTGKLVDVFPDGSAMNLTDGILRLRYRDSMTEPKLVEPGEVVEVRIDLGHTSNVFRAGHRIRLEISSSNFPRYSRNTNTGAIPELDREAITAEQTVYHDRARPSRLVLPVLR
jgi:putative CocE/NonD family hydrolase